jgi:hypothetical protein
MFNIPRFHVEFTPSTRILRGLDEIGAYLRVHRRTAWRWIMDYGFPAMQAPNGTWISSTSLVDLWILGCQDVQRPTKARYTAIDPSDIV